MSILTEQQADARWRTADWDLWLALQQDAERTPNDVVRLVKPDATDDECGYLLWEESCWPMGSVEMWLPQVAEAVAGRPLSKVLELPDFLREAAEATR